ncbi:MAG: sulfurtransferase TusA family protein [Deltaproteobacteria bacterium]|nr:MAG: sulfurtransferase TusA family protein [Deltaproteobacteria bacterium]
MPEKARRIDITGDVCPMTFVRVKMAMDSLPEGEKLEVVLRKDDVASVMSSVKTEGYRVLSVRDRESAVELLLEK